MISIYRKLFTLLDSHERRRFIQIMVMIVAMGLLDMIGVAAILPFLSVVADPKQISQRHSFLAVQQWTGLSNPKDFLILLGGLVFILIVVSLVFKTLTLYVMARFSTMRNHSIAARLLSRYFAQPYVWFLSHHSADLGNQVLAEVQNLVMGVLVPAMRVLAQSVVILFLVGLLIVVNPMVAFSAAALLGGAYVTIFFLMRRLLLRLGRQRLEAAQKRFQIAQEAMGGIKEVKILGLEKAYLSRFEIPSRQAATYAARIRTLGEMPRHLLEAFAFGGIILLVVALMLQNDGGVVGILPTLGVFAFAGMRMFPAVQQIYLSLTELRSSVPALDRIYQDIQDSSGALPPSREGSNALLLDKALELDAVEYAYLKTAQPVLHGLSLSIPARTTVGIVGGTGAGKTTAVDIMLGLLVPQAGTLSVDGVPLGADNLRAWQNALGYVPQQIFLVDDSVAANIALGIPAEKVDMAAVERAAKVANLHDFVVSELAEGYETHVGERGVRLSGGQRQRIGIARALYHDPDVLILDEATSALDNLTERAVMEAVHNLGHEKTIIMIAHRLSTVRACDIIFLMEKGQVVAQGTYDQLVAENETFRRMATA